MTDLRIGVEDSFFAEAAQDAAPDGRLRLMVHAMGLLSAGLGVWTVIRMFGSAGIAEQLGWMAAAWIAWSAVIAIKLWAGSCASGNLFADLRAAWSGEAR